MRAALLLAEKKTAEASARASHAESRLSEAEGSIQQLEIENKSLKDANVRITEDSKKYVATAATRA